MTPQLYQISPQMISGLTGGELVQLNALLAVWGRKMDMNARRKRYYDAHNQIRDLDISIPPQLRDVESVVGWPAKAVDALSARHILDGFDADGSVSKDVDAIVRDNDLRLKYAQAVQSELVGSCAFLTVSAGAEGEPDALINAYSPLNAAALWDVRRGRVSCGVAVVDVEIDEAGYWRAPRQVNYFVDDWVIECYRQPNNRWVTNRLANPHGRPLIEPLVYRPSLDRPFGKSRLSRPVMAIADSALRCALRTEVAAEFFTSPQKYLLGADKTTFGRTDVERRAKKLQAYLGSIFVATPNKNGDIPQFGQLSQMSMQPHTDYMQALAKRFAGETGIPVSSLGVIQDNPSSAEAMHAATEDIVMEAESLQLTNGRALRSVMRLALAIKRGETLRDLDDTELSVEPVFENPLRPSMASRADFALKVGSQVEGYAGTLSYWRDLGFTEAEARARMREVERNVGSKLILAQAQQAAAVAQSQAQPQQPSEGQPGQPDEQPGETQ